MITIGIAPRILIKGSRRINAWTSMSLRAVDFLVVGLCRYNPCCRGPASAGVTLTDNPFPMFDSRPTLM